MKPGCFGSAQFQSPLVECIFCCRPQTRIQATYCIDHDRNYVNFSDVQGPMPVYNIPQTTSLAPSTLPPTTSKSPSTTITSQSSSSTSSTTSPSTATVNSASPISTSSTTATIKSASSTSSTVSATISTSSAATASLTTVTVSKFPTSAAVLTSIITSTSPSMVPTTSPVPVTPIQSKSVCMECVGPTCGQNPVSCPPAQPYCMNIVSVQSGGIAVVKKSCASYTECHYETLLQQQNTSECSLSNINIPTTTTHALCRYCCSSNTSAMPCNIDAIPEHIITFKETSSQSTAHTTKDTPTATPSTDFTGTTVSPNPTSTHISVLTTFHPVVSTAMPAEYKVSVTPSTTIHMVSTTVTSASPPQTSVTGVLSSITSASPPQTSVTGVLSSITSASPPQTSVTGVLPSVTSALIPDNSVTSVLPDVSLQSSTLLQTVSIQSTPTIMHSSTAKTTPLLANTSLDNTPTFSTSVNLHTTPTSDDISLQTSERSHTRSIQPPIIASSTVQQTATPNSIISTAVIATVSSITVKLTTPVIQSSASSTPKPSSSVDVHITPSSTVTQQAHSTVTTSLIPATSNQTIIPVSPTAMTTNTMTTPNPTAHSLHTEPTQCAVCAGPVQVCETVYRSTTCQSPNNYCLNTIINHIDGTRHVERKCGNYGTCYREWYLGTSDVDRCLQFNPKYVQTLNFQCTFCCTKDNCNTNLVPPKDSLF